MRLSDYTTELLVDYELSGPGTPPDSTPTGAQVLLRNIERIVQAAPQTLTADAIHCIEKILREVAIKLSNVDEILRGEVEVRYDEMRQDFFFRHEL